MGGREPAHILLPFSLEEVYRRRPPFLPVSSSSDPAADAIYLLSWHIFAASSLSPFLGPNTKGKERGEGGDAGQTWGRTEMVQKKEFKTGYSCATFCNTGAYL